MYHAAIVRVLQGVGDLSGEGRPFEQFHDERAVFHAIDGRDMGMIEGGEPLRFARESRHPLGVGGKGIGQDFNSNRLPLF